MISLSRQTVALIVFGMLAVLLTFFAAERFWPMGPDYFYHYRPLADQWLSGYWYFYDNDFAHLLYPPWSAVFIAPLGLFSLEAGKAALFVLTLVCIVASLQLIYGRKRIPLWILFAAIANLHTFDVLLRGQLDTAVLFGLVLAWWAANRRLPLVLSLALCIATVKPPANIALPLVAILFCLRRWTWREIVQVAVFPVICLVASFFVFGLDWPIEFVRNLAGPIDFLSISVWRAAGLIGLSPVIVAALCLVLVGIFVRSAWTSPFNLRMLGIAVAINLLITTYANGDHYVLLIPAFVYVAQTSTKWSIIAYALTFTPLLRIWLGYDAAVADILYPVLLLGCMWFLRAQASPYPRRAETARESLSRVV